MALGAPSGSSMWYCSVGTMSRNSSALTFVWKFGSFAHSAKAVASSSSFSLMSKSGSALISASLSSQPIS